MHLIAASNRKCCISSRTFFSSIESVVRITGITAYMLIRSPRLAAYALMIVPVVAIVNKYYGNWLSENARKVQDALAEANSVAQETFSCIRTVIAFASENLEYEKYILNVDEQYRLNVKQVRKTQSQNLLRRPFICLWFPAHPLTCIRFRPTLQEYTICSFRPFSLTRLFKEHCCWLDPG